MKKHNNSGKKSEPTWKRAKPQGPMRRDTKEVLAELVGKLKEKLDPKKVAATSAGERDQRGELRPNLDRLTVGVDLGDQWSHYCILGLEGETLVEGQLRTTQEDIAEFFQALNAARVVFEVGTHSPWVQEVICSCRHEVLVANPRLMEGSKRRKRKNDRIDAHKLARLGRVDPQSLHPMQHRSREVRQDLVVLRARDVFTAEAPAGMGQEKYDVTTASMIALLRYGSGFRWNRLADLQESMGIPLPVATQCEIVAETATTLQPAMEELIRQAAQGEVLHNDDTSMPVLALRRKQAMDTDEEEGDAPERTGVFTSGIVSTAQKQTIALFFTGRQHAGENLADVLQRRAAELAPPLQMCDALSRNLPKLPEKLEV
ncbi:MAG: transposase, partial [Candidatus Sulfotelmatobacter sp.]